ncbi:MAG: hypothetical protein NC080_01820 [Paraprevotella sp.]|nr:hypothetical protein [Paraprevotella sp.]
MCRAFLLVILSICTCLFSYSQTEGWQVYPSYNEAIRVQAAGDYVYCLAKGSGTYDSRTGNLVRYDITDGSVKTYDCVHDLSDKEIAHISYNNATGRLIIIYSSGNMDLLDADDDIVNISALMDNSILGDNINGIGQVGETAYLCSDNGIIAIDCREAVVRETYRSFNGRPYSMVEVNGMLYVATNRGLYKFPVTANMHDKGLWTTPVSEEVYLQLVAFDNHIIGRKAHGISEIQLNGSPLDIIPNDITFLAATEDRLMFGMPSRIYIWEDEFTSRWININFPHQKDIYDITFLDGRYYIAEGIAGLNRYDMRDAAFLEQACVFDINSPRRDLFYHMHYVDDRLLVAGGINTQLAAYYPVTFMFMEDDGSTARWTLFDENALHADYPRLSHYNSVDLVQDPADSNHFFGAVSRNGLHEYRRGEGEEVEFIKLYNYENSPLSCIDNASSSPWNYCTCTALQYDKRGNLWMANQQTDTIVRILRPDGKWLALYYPEIVGAENVYQYLFSSHDINFLVSYDGGPNGFFGFDNGGTLNVTDDDRHLLRSSITNQDGTTVNPSLFYCMTEDRDRQIWCGTNEGLFVITSPQDWFESDFRFHQIKRSRNDGSGLADYLLAGVDITCIAVDPSNRKWIGTLRNGVYLVSHDGQETIYHFTKDNSPLLSDCIHSIAVHPRTGCVMFGTDVGLCSFEGRVTEPDDMLQEENVLAYPNPVRPGTNTVVTVQGLTDGAEVKILSSSGHAVWGAKSQGGTVRWNCCNMNGDRVPSGVYHVVCNTADAGRTVVTRIVVLK